VDGSGRLAVKLWFGFCVSITHGGDAGPADAAPAPDNPIQIFSLTVENQKAHLEWSGGQPPYRIQAANDPDLQWFDISAPLVSTSYFVYFDPDVNFTFYRIRTASDLVAPSAPSGLTVAARRCTSLVLVWEQARDDLQGSGVAVYRVRRDGVQIGEVPSPDRFFVDREADPEATLTYTITAVDCVGNESAASAPLEVASTICIGQIGPADEITLTWDPSDDPNVAGYLIYWGESPDAYDWVMDAMDYSTVSIPELTPGSAYFFAVTAYDQKGAQSDFSLQAAAITPAVNILLP
jgi:hypothetical protein